MKTVEGNGWEGYLTIDAFFPYLTLMGNDITTRAKTGGVSLGLRI